MDGIVRECYAWEWFLNWAYAFEFYTQIIKKYEHIDQIGKDSFHNRETQSFSAKIPLN